MHALCGYTVKYMHATVIYKPRSYQWMEWDWGWVGQDECWLIIIVSQPVLITTKPGTLNQFYWRNYEKGTGLWKIGVSVCNVFRILQESGEYGGN